MSESVAKLVGMSNLLDVEPSGGTRVRWGEVVLALAQPAQASSLGIRPERVRVVARGEDAHDNVLNATLLQTSLQGKDALLTCRVRGSGAIEVLLPETEVRRSGLTPGEEIKLSLPKADLHAFPPRTSSSS